MRRFGQFRRQILPGPVLIFMEPAAPFRTVGHIIDHTSIGNIDGVATLARVTAQLLLGKFSFGAFAYRHLVYHFPGAITQLGIPPISYLSRT